MKWIGSLVSCVCVVASAATNDPATASLPEVLVTASRSPSLLLETPNTVYVLDSSGNRLPALRRTMPDALQGVPSVLLQKTSYGQGSPFLRGFTGFRTLAMVDGIRLNNAAFRDGPNQYWSTIDPLSVDRYELVMGPGSALYGSDAIGGTVNALTHAPPEAKGWERRLFYRGATADGSTIGRVQVRGRTEENLGFVGGVSLKNFGNLRGGSEVGRQDHTGYEEQDYDAKLTYGAGEHGRLTFAHQSVRQDDAWRTHRTIYGIDWSDLAKGDDKVHSFDQRRDLTYLRYNAADIPGFITALEATLSRHAQGEDLWRVKKDDARETQGFDVETWGAALQLSSAGTPSGDWIYGVEYYRDGVDSFARKYSPDGSLSRIEVQGPIADDASYETVGLYAQDTITLLDGALDVVPGVRYTRAGTEAEKVKDPTTGDAVTLEGDWDAIVGSLRLLHPLTPDRRHVVFAGVGQGFRAPNLSDLSRFDIARSGELETPAPDLDPEQFTSFELGLKSRGDVFQTDLSGYYTWIDDMIVRTPTGRLIEGSKEVTKLNSGEGHVMGIELREHVELARAWSAWLALGYMDGEVDAYPTSAAEQESVYLSRIMPFTGQAGVRWNEPTSSLWVELVGDAAAKADRLNADDQRDTQRIPPGGTPGYAVFGLRGGTSITSGLDLTIALENLFDEDYRIHGSGVNEPGRNLMVSAEYTF